MPTINDRGWTADIDLSRFLINESRMYGYIRFERMDATAARMVLDVLPDSQYDECQNDGPLLVDLLRACINNPEAVTLSGYVIGPEREDERITVDCLFVDCTKVGLPDNIRARLTEDIDLMCPRGSDDFSGDGNSPMIIFDWIKENLHLGDCFLPDEFSCENGLVRLWWD